MKHCILFLAFLIVNQAFAQTTNFIEVAVDEMIELNPNSVKIQTWVLTGNADTEGILNYDFEMNDFLTDEVERAEWEYEEMIEDSPTQVTEEMKKAHLEYENSSKEWDERVKEAKVERRKTLAKFKAETLSEIRGILSEKNISFRMLKYQPTMDDMLYFHDDQDRQDGNDSVLEIVVTNQIEWRSVFKTLLEFDIDSKVTRIDYESLDSVYEEVIPKLTKSAKLQAKIMASSLNRKLGSIIECSNVYPFTPSRSYMESITGDLKFKLHFDQDEDPFDTKR
jgi:hypothetical protein